MIEIFILYLHNIMNYIISRHYRFCMGIKALVEVFSMCLSHDNFVIWKKNAPESISMFSDNNMICECVSIFRSETKPLPKLTFKSKLILYEVDPILVLAFSNQIFNI